MEDGEALAPDADAPGPASGAALPLAVFLGPAPAVQLLPERQHRGIDAQQAYTRDEGKRETVRRGPTRLQELLPRERRRIRVIEYFHPRPLEPGEIREDRELALQWVCAEKARQRRAQLAQREVRRGVRERRYHSRCHQRPPGCR